VSAHRYTDCRIDCDRQDCGRSEFASLLGLMEPTAAEARRILKARGWQVNVSAQDEGGGWWRADYCPLHKPGENVRDMLAREAAEAEERADPVTAPMPGQHARARGH
jgi:hypothetical protein